MRRVSLHRDLSEASIVEYLRKAGWSVLPVTTKDGPDLFIAKAGITVAIECKSGKRKLKPGQKVWAEGWQGTYFVLRDVTEAEALNKAAMPAVKFNTNYGT